MKHRINLYHSKFHPKLELLSPSSVVTMWSVVFGVMLLVLAGLALNGYVLEQRAEQLDAEVVQYQQRIESLQERLKARAPNQQLLSTVSEQKRMLSNRQLLLDELRKRERDGQSSFSHVLTDLAAQSDADLWLDRIQVDENQLGIEGGLTDPTAMPKWLNRLSQTNSFSGQTFAGTQVYRQDGELRFAISTERSGFGQAGAN